jgi:hypothetical protein
MVSIRVKKRAERSGYIGLQSRLNLTEQLYSSRTELFHLEQTVFWTIPGQNERALYGRENMEDRL